MSDTPHLFSPSDPLPAERTGVLTAFEPCVRTLPAKFKSAPLFNPLPIDILLEKDVAVTLRDGVTIYCRSAWLSIPADSFALSSAPAICWAR